MPLTVALIVQYIRHQLLNAEKTNAMNDTTRQCGIDNSITFSSDPSEIAGINAASVINAIRVRWSYPSVNPQSLAYVTLYRATTPSAPTPYVTVTSDSFTDTMSPSDSGVTYYYWVRGTSVNGTEGELVGPASATARDYKGDMIDFLSGQINSSMLAAALRAEIETIPSLRDEMVNEKTGRLLAVESMEASLAELGYDVSQQFSVIDQINTQTSDGMDRLASQLNVVAVSNGQAWGAITDEATVRLEADKAEITAREQLAGRVANNEGNITRIDQVVANEFGALATSVTNLDALTRSVVFHQAQAPTIAQGRRDGTLWYQTSQGNKLHRWTGSSWEVLTDPIMEEAYAGLEQELITRTGPDGALASSIDTLEANVGTLNGGPYAEGSVSSKIRESNIASIGYCMMPYNAGDPDTKYYPSSSAAHDTKDECEGAGGRWLPLRELSEVVKGVQISDGGDGLNMEEKMIAYRDELGKLQGQYTVKIQGSGDNAVIGGFGLATDSINGQPAIAAHFDVTRFSVGQLGKKVIPFIIEGDTVYMADVVIRNAVIDTAAIKTLNIEDNAVSHVDTMYDLTTNLKKYPTGTSTGAWFNTPTSEDQDVVDMAAGTKGSSGKNWPKLVMNFGEKGPNEMYDLLVHVSCEIGVKRRLPDNPSNYHITFQPQIDVQCAGAHVPDPSIYNPPPFILPRMTNSLSRFSTGYNVYPYSATARVRVNQRPGAYWISLGISGGEDLWRLNGVFSEADSEIGTVIEYVWIRNVTYSAHFIKK